MVPGIYLGVRSKSYLPLFAAGTFGTTVDYGLAWKHCEALRERVADIEGKAMENAEGRSTRGLE